MKYYKNSISTPVGNLIAKYSHSELYELKFCNYYIYNKESDNFFFTNLKKEIKEYFSKQRNFFTIELAPAGTPFQTKVWKELQQIPYNSTAAYETIAKRIKNKNLSRTVANAVGANPIVIIIPCHRVIRKNGKIGGFGGGAARKRFLLNLEKNGKTYA